MHFIPVSIQSAAAVRHIPELWTSPTRGADRPAPRTCREYQRHHFERVTFQYERRKDAVLDNLSLKDNVAGYCPRRSERLRHEHSVM